MPTEAGDIRYSEAAIRNHCEPPDTDAGNWTHPLLEQQLLFLAEPPLLPTMFLLFMERWDLRLSSPDWL